jgi:hypothetical protein
MFRLTLSALAPRRRFRPGGANQTSRCTFRPRLEALEDRRVPAHWAVTSPADNINQMGTLRWAVAQAGNGDTIDIQITQPIELTQGELYLAHDVTIDFTPPSPANQATINANFLSRAFEVAPTAHVNLDNLNIVNGGGVAHNPSGTFNADGEGGAILNQGTLALTSCTLAHNVVWNTYPDQPVDDGGGIYNNAKPGVFGTPNPVGSLTLAYCQVLGNSARLEGGGIYNDHGSVYVFHSTLESNCSTDFDGGGISSTGGVLTLARSDIVLNSAPYGSGGGVFTATDVDTHGLGFSNILWCTLLLNSAKNDGGGVFSDGSRFLTYESIYEDNHAMDGGGIAITSGPTRVSYCAFVSNHATAFGGAIFNGLYGAATVESSSLSYNVAAAGGGIYNAGVLNLGSTLLQTNTPDNLDNQGTYNDLGGNIFI